MKKSNEKYKAIVMITDNLSPFHISKKVRSELNPVEYI